MIREEFEARYVPISREEAQAHLLILSSSS
jgi:hypothetical protein